jgi:hypothetical protein
VGNDRRSGSDGKVRLDPDAFDTFLAVTGPGLSSPVTDDSGGKLNAEITLTFPESGVYRIVATSTASQATGAFRLSVTQ